MYIFVSGFDIDHGPLDVLHFTYPFSNRGTVGWYIIQVWYEQCCREHPHSCVLNLYKSFFRDYI